MRKEAKQPWCNVWRAIRHKTPFKKCHSPHTSRAAESRESPPGNKKVTPVTAEPWTASEHALGKYPFSWWAHVTMQRGSDHIAEWTCARQFDMTLSACIVAVEEVEPGVCRILLTYPCSPAGFLHTHPPAPPHTYAHSCYGLGGDKVCTNPRCFHFPSNHFSMFPLKSCHPSLTLFLHTSFQPALITPPQPNKHSKQLN